jgi:peptidoglycan lytic transglycosylase D
VLGRLAGALGAVWLVCWAAGASAEPLRYDHRFDVPAALQPQVDFWANIFAVYSRHQIVIHDTEHLDRVYRVLDFRDLADGDLGPVALELAMKDATAQAKEDVRAALLRIHRLGENSPLLSRFEQFLVTLFHDDPSPRKYLEAADSDRIRAQSGLRERFAEGIAVGHRYFREMEHIFEQEGVPDPITRLPLVESCFNVRAYSKAGASGIWQFMPSTARLFMRVDDIVDERLDPLISTRAAARFLRQNYERLGTWPLAITAYNHGPGGVARAVRDVGTTDISEILRAYHGPGFKFASRNFYAEFLAALEVEGNYLDYYGPIDLLPPQRTETVPVHDYVPFRVAASCGGIAPEELRELNPSLLRSVREGRRHVPRGYELRLPAGRASRFERCYASLPARQKHRSQKPTVVLHKVRRGQTLGQIARQYGSSVEEIRRHNGLSKRNLIRVGQVLRIPQG